MRTGRCLLPVVLIALVAGCDSSRDKLIADLQSPRADERAVAVKKLAQQGKSEDLVLFTRAAKDLAPIVRGEAASALGKSQDPRVVDLLGELLEDTDEDVQARAAMALAQIKSEKSTAYLLLQYGRRGRSTRLAIVQALKAANIPGAMAQVVAAEAKALWDRNLRALTQGAPPERVAAAEELGKSGRAEAVNRLLPLIKDNQVILAAAAVRGLGYAGDRRAVQQIALLLTENFPELRESACDALLRLQDPQALPTLKAVAIEKSATSPFATAALIALPRAPETDKALCEVVLEGGPAEALAAGHELRKRGGCPAEPIAERLAKVRDLAALTQGLQAVEALGPTIPDAAAKVIPLLAHPDLGVRSLALGAVTELGDPSAAPAVLKIYEQELKGLQSVRSKWITAKLPETYAPGFDPAVIRAAYPKARETGGIDRDKYDDLIKRVDVRNDLRVKESGKTAAVARAPSELIDDASALQLRPLAAAIRALGAVKAPGALEILKGHAQDGDTQLRTAALVGLAHLGTDGIAIAKAGLLEAERELQGAVAQALADAGPEGQAAVLEAVRTLATDRLRLLDALQRSGVTEAAVPTLKGLVAAGGPEVVLAAGMLASLKAKDATDALLKYLDDPTAVARRDVLLALGRIGDPRAAEVIAKDLNHDSPDVRAAAADALAMAGSAAQVEALDALKGDYFRRVRESAEAALVRVGGPAAEPRK